MTETDYISKGCARCGEVKPATTSNFSKCKRGIHGLHSWCRQCCAQQRREDRAARPEHYAEIERRRYARHSESRKAAARANWAVNKEIYIAASKPRILANRSRYNAARRAVRAADPDRIKATQKLWYEANKERQLTLRRSKWKSAPIQRKLRTVIGSAISHSLKGSGKGGKGWQQLVGYTITDLTQHLERQFIRGMSWNNYGTVWHVDHIIPVASFKHMSANDDSFKACWALSNLRPLWAKDNITKRDKLLYLL